MATQKEKWRTVGVPNRLFERIKKLIRKTGHVSVSEYTRMAIIERMKSDIAQLESENWDEEGPMK